MNGGKLLGSVVFGGAVIAFLASLVFTGKEKTPPPYSLQDTLPAMVSAFGGDARVVSIDFDNTGFADVFIRYEVIGSDGELHERDYHRTEEEDQMHAGFGYNRYIDNSVRQPTAEELRSAQLHLAQIPPRVIDEMFTRVGFPSDDSKADLTGDTWTLGAGVDGNRMFDVYQARYDGVGLHQTQSKASVFGLAPVTEGKSTSTSTSSAVAPSAQTTAPPRSTAQGQAIPTVPGVRPVGNLLACVKAADQNVAKLEACTNRYGPH